MPSSAYHRAYELFVLDRSPQALAELERGLQTDPDDAYCHGLYAVIQSIQKKPKEAKKAIGRALALRPEDDHLLYLAAVVNFNAGSMKDATKFILEALRLNPERAPYHDHYARIFGQQGRWRDALREVELGLRCEPENPSLLSYRTKALTLLGRKAEAEENARNLLRLTPDAGAAHADAGLLALSNGKVEDAFKSFREALRINPNSARAKAGVLDALRSRFPPYRVLYNYRLMLEGLPSQARVGVGIAIMMVPRLASEMPKDAPDGLRTAVVIVSGIGTLFVLCTFMLAPLTNIVICFHPFGRLLFNKQQIVECYALLGNLIALALLVGGAVLLHSQNMGFAAFFAGLFMFIFSYFWRMTTFGIGRTVFFSVLLLIEIATIVGFLASPPIK